MRVVVCRRRGQGTRLRNPCRLERDSVHGCGNGLVRVCARDLRTASLQSFMAFTRSSSSSFLSTAIVKHGTQSPSCTLRHARITTATSGISRQVSSTLLHSGGGGEDVRATKREAIYNSRGETEAASMWLHRSCRLKNRLVSILSMVC